MSKSRPLQGASFFDQKWGQIIYENWRRLRVEFFCFSNTMKFRILVKTFVLISVKVFVLRFDHRVALESNS